MIEMRLIEPDLEVVELQDLLSPQGNEIYLLPADNLWMTGVPLFVSMVTLGVVWFFAHEARKDREADQKFRQDVHDRKYKAAKAWMPMALGKMCKYTDHMARHLAKICEDIDRSLPQSPLENGLEEPDFEFEVDGLQQVFVDCIEHAPTDEVSSDKIALLMQNLQAFVARLDGSLERFYRPSIGPITNLGTVDEMANRFVELAALRAITDRLFKYARGRAGRADGEFSFEEHVHKTIESWNLDHSKIPNLNRVLNGKYPLPE